MSTPLYIPPNQYDENGRFIHSPQYPPMGQYGPPQSPAQQKNGLGISSFICGLVACVIGMIPLFGIPALAAALVGLGLGLGNIGRTRRHEASKVWTILGVVFSVIGVILAIVGIVIVTKAFNNLNNNS